MLPEIIGEGAVEWFGGAYKTILSTKETGGAMSIVDSIAPSGFGPPRHVHSREDECLVMLTGECEFWIDGNTFTRGPGESAFIPKGKEHTLRVIGDQPSRHLVILTPGGFENFFREMAEGQFQIPDDMKAINEAAARHNLTFTGPPLGAD